MALPTLPPLPQEPTGPQAPTLAQAPNPSALQALSGLFLLAQAMPQMLPQAQQQLATQRTEGREQQIQQFQLQQQTQQAAAEKAQRDFENQMKQLDVADRRERDRLDEEFRKREEGRSQEALDLQKRATTATEGAAQLNETEFKARAGGLLGTMFSDALDRVESQLVPPAKRAELLADLQTNVQYQALKAKDPKAAEQLLAGLAGIEITTTEKLRRATELVMANPGARQLMDAAKIAPEDVFSAELIPQELPENADLSAVSDLTLRRIMGGTLDPAQQKAFATALKNLGGTEAINKISDDLARMAEIKYGVDRDQFEQNLAELITVGAGPEQVALTVPSESKLTRLFGRDKESRIKDIKRKLRSPLVTARHKARLRAELAELEPKRPIGVTEKF